MKSERKKGSRLRSALAILIIICTASLLCGCEQWEEIKDNLRSNYETEHAGQDVAAGDADSNDFISNVDSLDNGLPAYDGNNYVTVNGNVPDFSKDIFKDYTAYEVYGELDELGRATGGFGCLGKETMPAEGETRGDIASVHPSGWASGQNWERCHLIAWALSGENANEKNLITGTHYLNFDGMKPFEERTEEYIYKTGGHVFYQVVPMYEGDNLVASGVHMMAASAEDKGRALSFNVYLFNVTPNASINYMTGIVTTQEQAQQEARLYVVNTRSKVFHYPTCEGAQSIFEHNRKEVTATRVELTSQGYTPCGYCQP